MCRLWLVYSGVAHTVMGAHTYTSTQHETSIKIIMLLTKSNLYSYNTDPANLPKVGQKESTPKFQQGKYN